MRSGSSVALLAWVLAVGCGPDKNSADFSSSSRTSSIVGGTAFAGLPSVGALLIDGEMACTATLIAPRLVMSAAHCLEGVSASSLLFLIGANAASPDHVLRVSEVRPHPAYDPARATHDIGLIGLSEDAPVDPVPVLTLHMDASWAGRELFFVGYGVTSDHALASAGKKRAVWMGISYVSARTFDYEDAGKNTCFGDSGGPAFYLDEDGRHFVAGVTSYGDESCEQWGVDTRVDAYLDFLGASPSGAPQSGDGLVVHGVRLSAAEGAAILALVNDESLEGLDTEIGLDGRAAANIVDARPIESIEGLANIPFVGASALEKLRTHVSAGQESR